MHQFFICNHQQVKSKLETLTKTGSSSDNWTHHYLDEKTNEKWVLTSYDSDYHGGGVSVLKRLPELSIEELIEIALISGDLNDIIGAALELSERERNNKEDFRDKLIDRLAKVDISELNGFEKERLKIIISESDLYDPTNRKNIIGKHFNEIQKDAKYYQTISQTAKNILADIEKYSR